MSVPAYSLHRAVGLTVDSATGLDQETLVFEEPREIFLTLIAPADGTGELVFGLAEEPGVIDFSSIRLYEGCDDVVARCFENGVVLLNSSIATPHVFDLGDLFPGEAYRRILGRQDPKHNSGEFVHAPLTLGPRDGIMLRSVDKHP